MKYSWLLKILVILGTLGCLCCNATTPTPVPAKLTDFTLCKGRDAAGAPIALPEIISPTEQQICICGDFKVDEESYLQVFWAYERESLQRDTVKWGSGPVTSCIVKNSGFAPGNYGVSVVYWRSTLGFTEFTVGEEPISAELTGLISCKGRDAKGLPIALPEIISSTEPQICICGDLKVDEESYLQVFWNHNNEFMQRDSVKWGSGPVTHCIARDEGFTTGHYGVSIMYGRSTLGVAEFTVEEAP